MKELVPKDGFVAFLLTCTDEGFVEFCRSDGLPAEPMQELARLADETLDGLDSANALDAAYAAFQVGYAMAFAEGPGKSVNRMINAKAEQDLIYSDGFRQSAIARATELYNQSPDPKWYLIAKKVRAELGGRPCYKTLIGVKTQGAQRLNRWKLFSASILVRLELLRDDYTRLDSWPLRNPVPRCLLGPRPECTASNQRRLAHDGHRWPGWPPHGPATLAPSPDGCCVAL